MTNLNDNKPSTMNGRITAFLDNKKETYRFCSSGKLKEAKKAYKDFVYIGSGLIYYVDEIFH
jgi:hypothetical protein